MHKPRRIQRQRTKGWHMPEGAVYVGRPSRWGNPFRPDSDRVVEFARRLDIGPQPPDGLAACITFFKEWVIGVRYVESNRPWVRPLEFVQGSIGGSAYMEGVGIIDLPLRPDPFELRGKDLVCWCPLDQPCHADVLLELANAA